MHLGLTYDLRSLYLAAGYSEEDTAEFDREETIDAIAAALRSLGHAVDRIGHVRQLVERLARGGRWDLVFNVCEGLAGIGREAQVPALLDAYGIPYTFSDPVVMAVSLDKARTKRLLTPEIPTPGHALVERWQDAQHVALPFPLFIKPVAEGTGKGISAASKVADRRQLVDGCRRLLERYRQPVLVESFLPGREFTVGLLGTGERARVLGTLEIVLREQAEPDVYSYVNKERCEQLVEYRQIDPATDDQVREAERVALQAWRMLGCRDAGRVDLRCDARGQPSFLEVNPLAGLHPQHSDLPMIATAVGLEYTELIDAIVRSAATRVSRAATGADAMPAQGR